MTRHDIIRYLILRTIGNFLLLFALFGVGATFGPAVYYEVQFRINQAQGVHYAVADPVTHTLPKGGGLGNIATASNEKILIPKDTSFSIIIPRIGADSLIIPNVDPANETEYLKALKIGVAHAKGSVFPGIPGATYLFAHSTDAWYDVGRYNAVFYLLKDVSIGDEITVFFKNRRYNYTVENTKIIDGNDVSDLVSAQIGSERLILQTCWPPGTTLKRLLVTAKPVKT